jgi:hypothetical protein
MVVFNPASMTSEPMKQKLFLEGGIERTVSVASKVFDLHAYSLCHSRIIGGGKSMKIRHKVFHLAAPSLSGRF